MGAARKVPGLFLRWSKYHDSKQIEKDESLDSSSKLPEFGHADFKKRFTDVGYFKSVLIIGEFISVRFIWV